MSYKETYDDEFDNPYRAPVGGTSTKADGYPAHFLGYGGFLRRFVAVFIDGILMGILSMLVLFVLVFGISVAGADPESVGVQVVLNLINIAMSLGYYAGLLASPMQATLGKAAMGLKVTDLQGRRISFLRAIGREFAKVLSALLLGIGYLMVLWDDRKQGLHDKLAGTLVLRSR